jgi:ribosomal RNA assembly protein
MAKKKEEEELVVDYINIPKDRVAVLIGKRGEVKRRVQRETKVKIEIDSESGEVAVTRNLAGDPLAAMKAADIIKAIARGFSPQKAFKLTSDNVYLEIIDLTEYVGDAPRALERVKSRIIGREGKARSYISRLTNTDIVIYGKTVAVLGGAEEVNIAKEALFKLIEGLPHNVVFRFVERRHRSLL